MWRLARLECSSASLLQIGDKTPSVGSRILNVVGETPSFGSETPSISGKILTEEICSCGGKKTIRGDIISN